MSNYQAASIRSGTRGTRKSTGSRSKPKPKAIYWAEARLTSHTPGHALLVVTDVGRNTTVLGLQTPGDDWSYKIYKAPGKNLSLGQVFVAWLQGDYALKRHAEAMNLAMSRAQKRELKTHLQAKAASLSLDSWQLILVETTLGGPMPKPIPVPLPEVVPGPEPQVWDTFEYKVLEDCNFTTCGGCATLEDKIQAQVYRECDEPDAYAECVSTVDGPVAERFGCVICGKGCDRTTANGFLIQFHGS